MSPAALTVNWVYDLFRIGQAVASAEDSAAARQQTLAHLVTGFAASSGCLTLAEDGGPPGRQLRIVAGIGLPEHVIGTTCAFGDRILGWVAERGEALLLNGDVSKDGRFKNLRARRESGIPVVALCWPLKVENRVIGTLSLNRAQGEPSFTEDDLRRGGPIVNLVAIVVENALLQAEQRRRIAELSALHNVLAIASDAVISTDGRHRITLFNRGAEQVFGHRAAEVIGLPLDMLLPARYADIHREHVQRFGQATEESLMMNRRREIVGLRRDGSEFPAEASISKLNTPDGVVYNVILRDVSERKRAEQELRTSHEELKRAYQNLEEAQSQLLQSEKLAAIGQLAAGVAHEINNPVGYVNSNLGTLQGYVNNLFQILAAYERAEPALAANPALRGELESLRQRLDLAFLREDALNLLKESQEGLNRVRKIVQDLKEFSHVDRAEWQLADLHFGLDSTLNIVWNELKYKAEVVKDYGALPPVECIPSQLNQVFMNLLVNAAQAIESRGTITLRTGTEGGGVAIRIEDTGKGMSPDVQKRIFEPFFTTKAVGKGTGLGLSLSYGIVKRHHGRIAVQSEPGKGTVFTVWLPVSQPKETARNAA
jgi:PAS domain S-box-containing protein